MTIISPSAIALQALNLAPQGDHVAHKEDSIRCAMCGTFVNPGETYSFLMLKESFTNQLAMAIPGGTHVCGACHVVMNTGAFQMSLATAVVSASGYFPIMKKENRAWAFLDPPEPPFFITVQNAQQQHVVWRAPVSLSKDLILVRVGEQILRLRRPQLIKARDIVFRLNEYRRNAARTGNKEKKTPDFAESPLVAEWKYQSVDGGTVKAWYSNSNPEKPGLLEIGAVTLAEHAHLMSLNAGEVWALQAVLHYKPVKPDCLTIES